MIQILLIESKDTILTLMEFFQDADVDAAEVSFIETHGTGMCIFKMNNRIVPAFSINLYNLHCSV